MREISRLLFVALFALVLSACASPNRSAHSVNMGRVLPPPDTTSVSTPSARTASATVRTVSSVSVATRSAGAGSTPARRTASCT